MSKQVKSQVSVLAGRLVEIEQERDKIIAQLIQEAGSVGSSSQVAAPPKKVSSNSGSGKGRGRPKGSKNKPKEAAAPAAEASAEGEERRRPGRPKKIDGSRPLPAILVEIAKNAAKPLTHAELVDLVLKSGYTSEAKNKPNMVQQALGKLVKKGTFTRDDDSRSYSLAESA